MLKYDNAIIRIRGESDVKRYFSNIYARLSYLVVFHEMYTFHGPSSSRIFYLIY